QQDGGADVLRLQLAGQFLAEEPARDERVVHPAKLPQGQLAQATLQRVADEEGAGQHGGADRHPESNGTVAAPVVAEVAEGQPGEGQGSAPRSRPPASAASVKPRRLPSTISRCWGKLRASSALCVTTTRMVCSCRCRSSRSCPTAWAPRRSRLPVGSSAS